MTLEEHNKTIVLSLLHRLQAGDMSAMNGHPALEETRRSLLRLGQPFSDLTASVEQIIAEGDRVAVHLRYRGTHTGSLLGIAPTGRRVDFEMVGIERLEDGLIVRHAAELGWLDILTQIIGLPLWGEGSALPPCTSP